MKANTGHDGGTRGLVLLLTCLLIGIAAECSAADREKTTPELLNVAKNPNNNPLARVSAIEKLGEMTDASQMRDYKVVDELISIAKVAEDDIFVRQTAIKGLGRLYNVDKVIKEKYLAPLIAILKDQKAHMMVRKAVAEIFRETLVNDAKFHADQEANNALLDVAKNKTEVPGLRFAAIKAVGYFGAPESLDVLIGLLSDPDPLIRENSAGALYDLLAKVGIEKNPLPVPTVNKLIEMVSDKKMAPELRVNVMKVLAQLIRDGQQQAKQVMPTIIDFVKNERSTKLVEGGIEALGIIGSAEAVEPLKVAYADYRETPPSAEPKKAEAKAEDAAAAAAERTEGARIRKKIMEALVSVLSFQTSKKQSEMKAVHECALLLVSAVDDDPAATVKEAAVFALRYLYPQKFKSEHKDAIDALIFRMRERATAEDLKKRIADTLSALTGQDFQLDAERWDEWFTKQFNMKPRAVQPKAAAPEPK